MLLLSTCAASAQKAEQPPVDPELPSVLAETPRIPRHNPRLQGLNAGVSFTSIHDSASGWYTLATPTISYNFSPHYELDLSMPIYLYRLAQDQTSMQPQQIPQVPPQVSQLSAHKFDPGDIFIAAPARFSNRRLTETLTPSITLPSGDTGDGLSTGRVTFDIDSHTALWLPRSALLLGVGSGDSSSLFNRIVSSDYTSLGYLAHFQFGFMLALPRLSLFQAVAYEQLPLGDSKIYTTLTRPGFPDRSVVSGRSVSEDNGFTNSLYIPLTDHVTLQGFYNRSLRLKTDAVGMGISFVLRNPMRRQQTPSYYDQILKQQ